MSDLQGKLHLNVTSGPVSPEEQNERTQRARFYDGVISENEKYERKTQVKAAIKQFVEGQEVLRTRALELRDRSHTACIACFTDEREWARCLSEPFGPFVCSLCWREIFGPDK